MTPQPPDFKAAHELATKINNVRESLIRLQGEARKLGFAGVAEELQFHEEELFKTVQSLRGNTQPKSGYAEL